MARGRQTGDDLDALAERGAEHLERRRRRGGEWTTIAAILDRNLDRMKRICPGDGDRRADEAVKSGLVRSPVREQLRRAFDVIEPYALHFRLCLLDPQPSASWRRDEQRLREAHRRLTAAIRLLAPLRDTHGVKRARRELQRELEISALYLVETRKVRLRTDSSSLLKGRNGAADRRRYSFCPVARALREHDGDWSWEMVGSLILRSGNGADGGIDDDWVEPPCPATVRYWADRDLIGALQQDARRS